MFNPRLDNKTISFDRCHFYVTQIGIGIILRCVNGPILNVTRTYPGGIEFARDTSIFVRGNSNINSQRNEKKKERNGETCIISTGADIRVNDSPAATVRANKFIRYEARFGESEREF